MNKNYVFLSFKYKRSVTEIMELYQYDPDIKIGDFKLSDFTIKLACNPMSIIW